jgi:hypothetical protein
MNTFKAGKQYTCKSICDSDCVFLMVVVSRTDKTIKVLLDGEIKQKSLRITVINDQETVKPLGNYSMCPVMKAN